MYKKKSFQQKNIDMANIFHILKPELEPWSYVSTALNLVFLIKILLGQWIKGKRGNVLYIRQHAKVRFWMSLEDNWAKKGLINIELNASNETFVTKWETEEKNLFKYTC